MAMPASVQVPRYTAAELRRFPEDGLRYEVIHGDLFVTPAPGTVHQRAVLELGARLKAYLEAHGLGEALIAPYEVEFAKDTAVQPDVLVILNDRAHQLTRKRLMGAPSLAVEVISYSSKRTDRLQKRALYVDEGAEEYWVVDPGLARVERWRAHGNVPEVLTDRLLWAPRPDAPAFELDLGAFFRKISR